jgi:hypothetical protein
MAWIRTIRDARAQLRVDPYFEWGRDTEFSYFFASNLMYPRRGRIFPVIIQLENVTARQFARGIWAPPANWRRMIRVPQVYRAPAAGLEDTHFCSAMVTEEFFDQLGTNARLRDTIRRVELGVPINRFGDTLPLTLPPVPRRRVRTVVTAVIDDGMAFAHESFRLQNGRSRFEFFWNQDAPPPAPSGFTYGREFSKYGPAPQGIDAVMLNASHAGLVDEDEVYHTSGHLHPNAIGHKPVAWRMAHGTHVMDLASGFEMQTAPNRRPLIGVQLPVRVTADTSGGTFGPYALDAMQYILKRADQIAVQPLPVVINLSYGFMAGPHDGSSVFEEAVDELIALRAAPLDVVLPAGNNYLSRCHAQFQLPAGRALRRPLRWRMQPDDSTPSYMQIWLPHKTGPRARIRIRIRTPYGNVSPWINEGDTYSWQPAGATLCKAVYYNSAAPGRNRNMILIAVAPTSSLEASNRIAPAGIWEIEVRNVGPDALIDAWIQRDDKAYAYPTGGRQSYFDDPRYVRFDESGREAQVDNASYVKRAGSINSLATGRNTVVVGGYRRKQALSTYFAPFVPAYAPAKYSSSGPIVRPAAGPPHRTGPDAMAISDSSPMNDGRLAGGTRSGSVGSMWGTSVAAPQVTRWIAGEMRAGRPHGRGAVAAWAAAQEAARPAPNPQPALTRMGSGRGKLPLRRLRANRYELP